MCFSLSQHIALRNVIHESLQETKTESMGNHRIISSISCTICFALCPLQLMASTVTLVTREGTAIG